MNKNKVLFVVIASLVILGCSFAQSLAPTLTPPPTATIPPAPTSTSTPISTPTSISLNYVPVPRWMILGQPGYNIDISGETWKYAGDKWGETYGCIDYKRENGTSIYFQQCFAMIDDKITFESQRDLFLGDGFEALAPQSTFGNIEKIALLGKRLPDDTKKVIEFFEVIGIDQYVILVELYIEIDNADPLQDIYESQAADIMNYALQDSLQKSRFIPRPTPTPLSASQQKSYGDLAAKLVTDTEASEVYTATWMGEAEGSIDGTWEALGDRVQDGQTRVCRLFEDRTNVDVRWVKFQNCISAAKELPLEKIASRYNQPGDTVLTSSHEFENDFVIYGYNDGHTFFDAYLLDGEFIYQVSINSRTMAGEKVEDVFNQTIDDFIYKVLMINVKK